MFCLLFSVLSDFWCLLVGLEVLFPYTLHPFLTETLKPTDPRHAKHILKDKITSEEFSK